MASLNSLFSLAVFSCLLFSHCFAHAQPDCRYATCDVPTCRYPVSIPGRCCSVCRPKAGQRGPSEKCPRADISLPCGDTCRVDTDCPATQKCCDHGCGKSCRDRVTIASGACPYGYPKPSADCQKLSGAACPTGYYCKYALAANKAECCPTSEYQGYTPPCHNAVCTPVYCSQPYIPQGQCCPVCPPQASAPPAQQPYMQQQQQQQQQSGGVCANVMCPDIYCYNPVLPPGACCYVCPEATTIAPVPQHQQQPQYQPHQQNIQQVQQGFQQLQQSFQQQPPPQQPPQQQQALQSQPMDFFQAQSQQPQQPQFQPQSPPQPQVQQQVMAQPQPQPQPSHQPSFFDSLMCAFAFCQDVNCPGSFIPPGECCHVCPPDPCAGVMCSQVTCPNPYVPDGQCCLVCPPDRPCVHNGKSYKSGQIFAHDCNNCTCNNGNLYCTNQTCEQKCNYNGRIYSSGVTVSNTICQTCTCGNGVIYCTEDACTRTAAPRPKPTREIMTRPIPRRPPVTRAPPLTRAPPTYPPPTRARDPCSGVVCPRTTCQVTYQPLGTCCPICLNKGECLYEGKMYKNGEIQSANNCQKCTCMDGMMVCSNDCIQRATPPPRRITTTMYVPRPTTRGPPPAPPPRQRSGARKQSNGRRGPPPGPPPPPRSGAPQGDTYPRPPLLVQTYEEIQAASNKRLAAAAASKRRAAQAFQPNPGSQANLGPQYNPGPQFNPGPQYNPVPPMNPNPRNSNPRNPNPRPPGNMPVRAEVYDARPRVEPSRRTPARTQAFQYEQMLEGPISRSEPSPGLTYKDIKEPLPTRIYPNTMAPRFRPPQPSPRYPALRKRTYPPVPARPGSSKPIPMGPKSDPRADRCTNVQCVKPNCPNYVIPPGECCPICKPKKKLPKKPGECPPVLRAGLCVKFCDTDHDCKGNQICCFNGCSQQCFDPVAKT